MSQSVTEIRQQGEAQFFADMSALATLLIPDEEQRRNDWFAVFQQSWKDDQEWYFPQLDEDDVEWALLDCISVQYWMGANASISYEQDADVFTGKNWFMVDWKDTETTLGFVESLSQRYGLQPLQWSVADPENDLSVTDLCTEASQQLLTQGYHLLEIDTESDSFVLLFLHDDQFPQLDALAERLNMEIFGFGDDDEVENEDD